MSVGLDSYKYDCSWTGFSVENCSTPTFSDENKVTAEAYRQHGVLHTYPLQGILEHYQ